MVTLPLMPLPSPLFSSLECSFCFLLIWLYMLTWDMISAYMRHNFCLYEIWLLLTWDMIVHVRNDCIRHNYCLHETWYLLIRDMICEVWDMFSEGLRHDSSNVKIASFTMYEKWFLKCKTWFVSWETWFYHTLWDMILIGMRHDFSWNETWETCFKK